MLYMTKKSKINAECGGEFAAQPITVPAGNGADKSDWLRLPKPRARLWGLSRTTWNELLDSGKVRGITIRKRNAQRGIKLIFRPSAETYLRGLMGSTKEVGK